MYGASARIMAVEGNNFAEWNFVFFKVFNNKIMFHSFCGVRAFVQHYSVAVNVIDRKEMGLLVLPVRLLSLSIALMY